MRCENLISRDERSGRYRARASIGRTRVFVPGDFATPQEAKDAATLYAASRAAERLSDRVPNTAECRQEITDGRLAKPDTGGWGHGHGEPVFWIGPHLYLVEFVGHCVKVGVTNKLHARLKAHRAMAKKMGRVVGRIWVTPRHYEAKRNEQVLKGCSPTEYLTESFDALVARARSLEMTFDDEDDTEEFESGGEYAFEGDGEEVEHASTRSTTREEAERG